MTTPQEIKPTYTVLKNHTTFDNGAEVDNYPWGFSLKTKRRYWIETSKTHGQRLAYATMSPKTGQWCKPKRGTYSYIKLLLKQDDNGYIVTDSVSKYASSETMSNFLTKYENDLSTWEASEIKSMIRASDMVGDFYKEQETKTIEAHKERVSIDDMPKNTLLTKKDLLTCKDELKTRKIEVIVTGVKKRCRNVTTEYITLGYVIDDLENWLADVDLFTLTKDLIAPAIEKVMRETKETRIKIVEVTYKPANDGSMFHGMSQMLMGGNTAKLSRWIELETALITKDYSNLLNSKEA